MVLYCLSVGYGNLNKNYSLNFFTNLYFAIQGIFLADDRPNFTGKSNFPRWSIHFPFRSNAAPIYASSIILTGSSQKFIECRSQADFPSSRFQFSPCSPALSSLSVVGADTASFRHRRQFFCPHTRASEWWISKKQSVEQAPFSLFLYFYTRLFCILNLVGIVKGVVTTTRIWRLTVNKSDLNLSRDWHRSGQTEHRRRAGQFVKSYFSWSHMSIGS